MFCECRLRCRSGLGEQLPLAILHFIPHIKLYGHIHYYNITFHNATYISWMWKCVARKQNCMRMWTAMIVSKVLRTSWKLMRKCKKCCFEYNVKWMQWSWCSNVEINVSKLNESGPKCRKAKVLWSICYFGHTSNCKHESENHPECEKVNLLVWMHKAEKVKVYF